MRYLNKKRGIFFLLIAKVLVLFFFFLACNKDNLLKRATADYFPMDIGRYWYYYSPITDTIRDSIVGDTFLFGKNARIIERNFIPEFFVPLKDGVQKFIVWDTFFGEVETLLKGYLRIYQFPLISGKKWRDSITDTIYSPFLLDTLISKVKVFAQVGKNQTLKVPAGEFSDVYPIEFYFDWQMQGLRNTTIRDSKREHYLVYLAPEIGVIRKEYDSVTEDLVFWGSR